MIAITMPKKNARLDTMRATAASLRCASVMRTATSATTIATGANTPGERASATPESARENAQRNPATRSALECAAASIRPSARAELEPDDRVVDSDVSAVASIGDVAIRPTRTE